MKLKSIYRVNNGGSYDPRVTVLHWCHTKAEALKSARFFARRLSVGDCISVDIVRVPPATSALALVRLIRGGVRDCAWARLANVVRLPGNQGTKTNWVTTQWRHI